MHQIPRCTYRSGVKLEKNTAIIYNKLLANRYLLTVAQNLLNCDCLSKTYYASICIVYMGKYGISERHRGHLQTSEELCEVYIRQNKCPHRSSVQEIVNT